MSLYAGLSEAGLRANMAYFNATRQDRKWSECWEVLNMPRINKWIIDWNSAMRELDAKHNPDIKRMEELKRSNHG